MHVNPFDDLTSKLPRTFVMGDSLFYKPSGRLSGRQVDGASMSYTYDIYGRLTECEAHMVAEPGSDYSTSYTYDANSNITSLRRAGAIDRVGNTIETGYHSEAEFELEGNRISWGTLWSVANTFEGATGILQDDAEVYHEYDAQGRLTASNTDQIAEIEYNHLSQPVRVKFFDGKEQFSVYDNAGQLIKRYTRTPGGRADRIDQIFIGPYEFEANRTLKKIHFAGGYFTPDGKVHYHITDYQGSVGAVIRGDGVVEQRTHYYPYGEPWLEPEGDNRRLHTGKERLLWGSTPIHDFGARILPPAIPFWTTPDPCAEKYYHLGPYTFCAADPINHSDPNGCVIRVDMGSHYCIYECIDGVWGLYRENSGEIYKGGNEFADWVILGMQYLQSGATGAALVDFLVSDSEVTTIKEGDNNEFSGSSKTISWRPKGSDYSIIETPDGYALEDDENANTYIYLVHEAGHSFDLITRPEKSQIIDNKTNRESTAVYIENCVRFEHGMPLRVGYGHSKETTTGAKIEMFPDKEFNQKLFRSNRYILKRIESQKNQRMQK